MKHDGKRALHYARRLAAVAREQGIGGLYGKVAQRLSPSSALARFWHALYDARHYDFTSDDLIQSQSLVTAHSGILRPTSIHWFLPHFEHAYYGGIYTILRFAAELKQRYGVRSSFIITDTTKELGLYALQISQAFPALDDAQVLCLSDTSQVSQLAPADASIATLWSTAYYVLKFQQTKRKFYFIQDFEPAFYPAGSTSAQAEVTYRFGFYGLTNTCSLKAIYEHVYHGTATSFNPCVDTTLFQPPADEAKRNNDVRRVFFYARPTHPRNGFELGVAALQQLKAKLGPQVQIITAGQAWNPARYGLSKVIENLGRLSYQETAELYRTCDVGLVMMFTRHPSYLPFELMASGCLVVSNINPDTTWFLKDGQNCLLTLPSASCIAETIATGLENDLLRQDITARALKQIRAEFSDWHAQIDLVYKYMCNPEGYEERR